MIGETKPAIGLAHHHAQPSADQQAGAGARVPLFEEDFAFVQVNPAAQGFDLLHLLRSQFAKQGWQKCGQLLVPQPAKREVADVIVEFRFGRRDSLESGAGETGLGCRRNGADRGCAAAPCESLGLADKIPGVQFRQRLFLRQEDLETPFGNQIDRVSLVACASCASCNRGPAASRPPEAIAASSTATPNISPAALLKSTMLCASSMAIHASISFAAHHA